MVVIGRALLPDWSRINCGESAERLYSVARHASFMAEVRATVLLERTPPASLQEM